MIRRVYVEQYGYFWSLSPTEWQAVLEAGASGTGYELPKDRELRRMPRHIRRDRRDGDAWSASNDHPLYRPLDWSPEDFAEALADL